MLCCLSRQVPHRPVRHTYRVDTCSLPILPPEKQPRMEWALLTCPPEGTDPKHDLPRICDRC